MLEQRQWMRIVRDRCATDACLAAAYKIRLVVLRDGTDPVSGPGERNADKEWLWRFQYQIHDVLMPADKYHLDRPISLNNAVVVTYDANTKTKRKSYLESLNIAEEPDDIEQFRMESLADRKPYQKGCLFYAGEPGELRTDLKLERDGVFCAELRKRAAGLIAADGPACKGFGTKYVIKNKWGGKYRDFMPRLFVDAGAHRSTCFIGFKPYQEAGWYEAGINRTQTLSYLTGFGNDENIATYLDLDSNRIFGCQRYGAPTRLWKESLPAGAPLPISYPRTKEPSAWMHHYLVLTSGFPSDCSNSIRLIDEPKYASFRINDGTVLMRGNHSLLRIKEKDGSTDAPKELVKVLDPKTVRLALDRFDTRDCKAESLASAECSLFDGLGWRKPHWVERKWGPGSQEEQRFRAMVIEAVDTALIRSFFVQ
jgi:hypothetical protein